MPAREAIPVTDTATSAHPAETLSTPEAANDQPDHLEIVATSGVPATASRDRYAAEIRTRAAFDMNL